MLWLFAGYLANWILGDRENRAKEILVPVRYKSTLVICSSYGNNQTHDFFSFCQTEVKIGMKEKKINTEVRMENIRFFCFVQWLLNSIKLEKIIVKFK